MVAPLVSCIMPTADRRAFVPRAVACFLRQDHPQIELIVVDDGDDAIGDLLPDDERIRYVRVEGRETVGVKRNRACELARGELIAHWDDDDWFAPERLSVQVAALQASGRALCGITRPLYYDVRSKRAWRYVQPVGERRWLTMLLYTRRLWASLRFGVARVGSDTAFVWRVPEQRQVVLDRDDLMVCTIHAGNVSPKVTVGSRWQAVDVARVRALVGADGLEVGGASAGGEGSAGEAGRVGAARAGEAGSASVAASAAAASVSTARAVAVVEAGGGRATGAVEWTVVVHSCERPLHLRRLLGDLAAAADEGARLDVRVYDDASTADLSAVAALVAQRGWRLVRAAERHGKRRFGEWLGRAWHELREVPADRLLVFLQDDVRLCRDFFGRAAALWRGIDDGARVALSVLVDGSRGHGPCWTGVAPERVGAVWRTQWVDGIYVADRRLLAALDFAVPSIAGDRWARDATVSSGVGQAVSTRLHAAKLSMYQVHESLVAHGDGPSQMNPEARAREPMRAVRFVDGEAANERLSAAPVPVVAGLATIPAREAMLGRVVASLRPQVDRLGVFLNGHRRVPEVLAGQGIEVRHSVEFGLRGDAGKFFWCETPDAYLLTCDDDIVYPPDYSARLVDGIERYRRRAVVGVHGIKVRPPVGSYYRDRDVLHFRSALAADVGVHLVGTGCAGWYSGAVRVTSADFARPDMADIWFGLACQRQRVPVVALARGAGWLEDIESGGSIYERARFDDAEQSRLVRMQGRWHVYPAK